MWVNLQRSRDFSLLQNEAEDILRQGWVKVLANGSNQIKTMSVMSVRITKVSFGDLYQLSAFLRPRFELLFRMLPYCLGFFLIGPALGPFFFPEREFPITRYFLCFGLSLYLSIVVQRTFEYLFQRRALQTIKSKEIVDRGKVA